MVGASLTVPAKGAESTGQQPHSANSFHDSYRKRQVDDPSQEFPCMTSGSSSSAILPGEGRVAAGDRVDAAQIFLSSHPTTEELKNMAAAAKGGFALTGTAAIGEIGPAIGHMDIGECEDSYLFRVSLAGVKRDERKLFIRALNSSICPCTVHLQVPRMKWHDFLTAGEFSCEVEYDGKVVIRGVTTTGETTVNVGNQVFEMQTQNLCPSGHFSISFQLPGPVDPLQFSGDFGTDGILEGMVMKRHHRQ